MQSRSPSDPADHENHTNGTHDSISEVKTPKVEENSTEGTATPDHDGAPPLKKRKLADPLFRERSSSRPTSPPWKKVAVDGPTSFVEGGRRKSSRVNAVPLELQPQSEKRQTRAAAHQSSATKVNGARGAAASTPATSKPAVSHASAQSSGRRSRPAAATKPTQPPPKPASKTPGSQTTSTRTSARRASPHNLRQHHHNQAPDTPVPAPRSGPPTRRSARTSGRVTVKDENVVETNGWHDGEDDTIGVGKLFKPQKLKFRVRAPTVPVLHPDHALRPRQFSSFQEWLEADDATGGEDGALITAEDALKEARIRQRVLDAIAPGGILSEERCSIYIPDAQEEPARQYAHQDHLVSQALHFQRLLFQEQRHHRNMAKKLAYAAAAEWKRRQPKTKEELVQEQLEATILVYRQVRKALQQKWEMVTAEVNRRRLERWEEEQQALGKQALNQMLEQSTALLDKRRMRRSSEVSSDVQSSHDDSEASDRSENEEDNSAESNMSSSGSESGEDEVKEVDNDEGLTIEELRRKYSAIAADTPGSVDVPEEPSHEQSELSTLYAAKDAPEDDEQASERGNAQDTDAEMVDADMADVELEEVDEALMDDSDESTDMDDDMGDSDEEEEENDDEQDAGDASEESDEEDVDRGLLGFFSKKEIEQARDEPKPPEAVPAENNAQWSDEEMDEISLIPDHPLVPATHAPETVEIQEGAGLEEKPTPADDVEQNLELSEVSRHPSSRASPETNPTTKPSDGESASSVEPQVDQQPQASEEPSEKPSETTHGLRTPLPFLLRGTLREYQHYGLDWLAGLYSNHTNGILADEMGLGKTIQTIALLAHLACEHEVWGPHLIVVPTSVMLNWEMEFKKWCPGFKILTYYGSQEERKQKRKGWLDDDRWHVCITSYQLVLQDQQTFKRRNWHYMILDEAHNIKNFRSQRWQTLLTFKTRARLLLTGTPLQNNLTELWSLLFFLMPSDSRESGMGGFADLKEFSDWFRRPVEQILEHGRETMDDEAKGIVTKLHKVLRPYLLRRLKADVEKQMPAKYEHVVYCRLSKRQRFLYDGFMSLAQTRETLSSGNYLSIINCLMQLRKVCNHPDLFETRQIVTSFAMPKSVVADFEIKDLFVRRRLLREDLSNKANLDFLNFSFTGDAAGSLHGMTESSRLTAIPALRERLRRQHGRIDWRKRLDGSSMESTLAYMENAARYSRLEELRHCVYINSLRTQKRPVYGEGLLGRLTLDLQERPLLPRPKKQAELSNWALNSSSVLRDMVKTIYERSQSLESTIQAFGCVTPAVVATDLVPLALQSQGMELVQRSSRVYKSDPFHEARIRLSIAFPDKRLLQYDCGKLQRLDRLLRELQANGHRALIFTQMTKVLDILEQFLNIHGHRYLRLDGATKIEQRQILTDRFNNDNRILAFILSTRSGGLGINLTGADTVIFYDLDWNPAMDKQCQDRCHRIGQTRDVHIYRFVSEYTIESNILRKSNQKRMLDDVVIQEGEFTTDYFNKLSIRDMLGDEAPPVDEDSAANAAMDRVLGGMESEKALQQVEDREDRDAARLAEKEMVHTDDADFEEKAGHESSSVGTPKTRGPSTPRELMPPPSAFPNASKTVQFGTDTVDTTTSLEAAGSGLAAPDDAMDAEMADADEEEEPGHIDEYMLRYVEWELKDVPVAIPLDPKKKKAKKGQAHHIPRRR
ncbi:hypothetical protein L228DRAFT_283293 [Xylona heveae TC161]|uniref:DNA helicase n=1 Tax=Xylona heveae (strain CBS 132557 / TC161) TaxID=1328760 RepID=A0A165GF34_XYLHT|nr:hypothetical protein L228DRAFT_283293 [Xylona heveae TC161]KZF22110.1 hypothetical protein L228DRAFT_283293 [Xylona heveae TC161]